MKRVNRYVKRQSSKARPTEIEFEEGVNVGKRVIEA